MREVTDEDMTPQPLVASTTVRNVHTNRVYIVSTINRRCSALGCEDMWYSETLVFDTKVGVTCGKIIDQAESGMVNSLKVHFDMVTKYSQEVLYAE